MKNLKLLVDDYKAVAEVGEVQLIASENRHSDKPSTYEGEYRLAGGCNVFNRLFADVVNAYVPEITKEVKRRAKEEWRGMKSATEAEMEKMLNDIRKL